MSNLLHHTKKFVSNNSSTILTWIGGAGVITTAVAAVKDTTNALERIKAAKAEKDEELTKLEIVKVAAPAYISTAVSGITTIVCIFGANKLNKRQQASLMSAYAFLDNSYKNYKDKVEEMYGEGTNYTIEGELAKDAYKESDLEVDDGMELFYDAFSGRYFESTMEAVKQAWYDTNRELVNNGTLSLNEHYAILGLVPIDCGDALGWSCSMNFDTYWQTWIDFHLQKVEMEDGMECNIITMYGEPCVGYDTY